MPAAYKIDMMAQLKAGVEAYEKSKAARPPVNDWLSGSFVSEAAPANCNTDPGEINQQLDMLADDDDDGATKDEEPSLPEVALEVVTPRAEADALAGLSEELGDIVLANTDALIEAEIVGLKELNIDTPVDESGPPAQNTTAIEPPASAAPASAAPAPAARYRTAKELADERERLWKQATFRMVIERQFGKRARIWSGLRDDAALLLRKRENKRRQRAKTALAKPAPVIRVSPLPPTAELSRLVSEWLAKPGRRQKHIKDNNRVPELRVLIALVIKTWSKRGRHPTHADVALNFSKMLGAKISRQAGGKRLAIIDAVLADCGVHIPNGDTSATPKNGDMLATPKR